MQGPEDIDRLAAEENVDVIFSLQENSDMEYFGIEVARLQARAAERGDIQLVRHPIHDFDPFDLRLKLPSAVSLLARAKGDSKRAYVHCTAGLGRAPGMSSCPMLAQPKAAAPGPYLSCFLPPGTALAYMYWVHGIPLDDAYQMLYKVRNCNPKLEAIRSATVDLLLGSPRVDVTIGHSRAGSAAQVQVAGLDVGWGRQIDLERERGTGRFVLRRSMPIGQYQYKWIVDGHWTYSADHPTVQDGEGQCSGVGACSVLGTKPCSSAGPHINNWIAVIGNMTPAQQAQQRRIMTPGAAAFVVVLRGCFRRPTRSGTWLQGRE